VSSAVLLASQMVHSGDVEAIAQELVRQTERYELLRGSYAQALSKLQEERGGIMVCCRLRPCTEAEASAGHSECVDAMSDRELALFDRRGGVWRDYGFDRVWRPEATQREVFSDIEPLVLSLVQGINCCLFAYGPTGSGKTHTIVGDPAAGAQGISYRTLRKLFEVLRFEEARHLQVDTRARLRSRRRDAIASGDTGAGAGDGSSSSAAPASVVDHIPPFEEAAAAKKDGKSDEAEEADTIPGEPEPEPVPFAWEVHVSMFEIYNESIRDLLVPLATRPSGSASFKASQASRADPPSLDARTQLDGSIAVAGLKKRRVTRADEAAAVFVQGTANRATAHTNLNEHSSRSHCLMQVELVTKQRGSVPCRSRMYLVDLAGSERVEKSRATGAVLREAQHINRSLSALGDVMEALDRKREHVPYRNSKLTYVLQDALGGNSRTMMVLALSPSELHAEESLVALQFAARVRDISSQGPASRLVDVKNVEESLHKAKSDLRTERQKRVRGEEQVALLQRDLRTAHDKVEQSLEYRAKGVQEARSGMDEHVKALAAAVEDWKARWSEERNVKLELLRERELQRREGHGADVSFRDLQDEKDHLAGLLKLREREVQDMKVRETLTHTGHSTPRAKTPLPLSPYSTSPQRMNELVLRSSMSAAAAAVASAITAEKRTPPPDSEAQSSLAPARAVGAPASRSPVGAHTRSRQPPPQQARTRSAGASGASSAGRGSASRPASSVSKLAASGKPPGVKRKSSSPELTENPPELLVGMGREITPPQVDGTLGHRWEDHPSKAPGSGRNQSQGTPSIAERSAQAMRLHKQRMEKRRLEKEALEKKRDSLW
jgi:hypothetical protein